MWRSIAASILLLTQPLAAWSDDKFTQNRSLPWYEGPVDSRWWAEAGLGFEIEPDYVGSDDYLVEPEVELGLFYKPGDKFRLTLTPMTLGLVWKPNTRNLLQLVIEDEEGRESGETTDLRALPDGNDTIEAELTYARRLGESSFAFATYQPEIQDRDKGQVYFIGAGNVWDFKSPWQLTVIGDISLGDAEHMQTEFGVSENDSGLLGVPSYSPSGGLKSSTVNLIGERLIGKRWRFVIDGSVEYYFSEAADSPLLDELGATTTAEVEVSVVYTF